MTIDKSVVARWIDEARAILRNPDSTASQRELALRVLGQWG